MLSQHLLLGQLLQRFQHLNKCHNQQCKNALAPMPCDLGPIPSKFLIECIDSILPSLADLFNFSLAFSHNASSQLLSHIFSKSDVVITMI